MDKPTRGVRRLRRGPRGPLAAVAPRDPARDLPIVRAEPGPRGRGLPAGLVPCDELHRDRQICVPRSRLRGDGGHYVRDKAALLFFAPVGSTRRAGGGTIPQVRPLRDAGEPDGHGSPVHEDVQGHACR